jgi:hypothetical protein
MRCIQPHALRMGTRIRFLGCTDQGLGTPSFPTHPSMRATVISHARDRDWRASTAATGGRIVPSSPESLWERDRGCFGGPVGVPHGREPRGVAAFGESCQGNHSALAKSLVTPRMQDGIRGTSRRCGGGFAEQVARNIEKCEAATLLRERIEIRLDENLHGLFAGINLNTNGRVAKVDLVPSSVHSSNDGVGHYRGKLSDDQARQFELGASRTTGARIGLFKNAADDRCQEDHYADKQQSGNYLFAQGNPERSAALIVFGGPHSSDPERPGAQVIAPLNRCNYVFHDHSRSDPSP